MCGHRCSLHRRPRLGNGEWRSRIFGAVAQCRASLQVVRWRLMEVAPHATTLVHWHRRDYMWVAIGAAEVTNIVTGKPPVKLKLQDGETRFTAGNFSHKATNDAATQIG